MQREALIIYLEKLLNIKMFNDYCPNGLQVEGKLDIHTLTIATTASLSVIEQAIADKSDALLVHHGYFWKNENPCIRDQKYRRIKSLLLHDINLFAYHLPLDAHPELGNNYQLGVHLGFNFEKFFGEQGLIALGHLPSPMPVSELAHLISGRLGRKALLISQNTKRIVRTIAWCTGGAQHYFAEAIRECVDVYITGEVSESQYHMAMESGVDYIAAGHHATERYGVLALAKHLESTHQIRYRYVEIDNPV